MTLDWLATDLRSAGLDVREIDGWQTRARPGGFDPVGVLIHDTGTPKATGDAPSLQTCIDGRTDLRGPLCQLLIARSAVVYVIAGGRCNHAGAGGVPPWVGVDQGNAQLVGIEMENTGTGAEPWPARQVEAGQICTAVILRRLGNPATRCWGHREYALPPGRKPDPVGVDMNRFRAAVAAILRGDDMTPQQIQAVKDVQAGLAAQGVPGVVMDGNPIGLAGQVAQVYNYLAEQLAAASANARAYQAERDAALAKASANQAAADLLARARALLAQ